MDVQLVFYRNIRACVYKQLQVHEIESHLSWCIYIYAHVRYKVFTHLDDLLEWLLIPLR